MFECFFECKINAKNFVFLYFSLLDQNKKNVDLTTFFIHVYLSQPYIYGDGGSRTRVQTHRHLKIYVHSQLI